MNNEGTVVELTFEGDDRVFFVVTDVHTMAEEDQAAAAYLGSYEGPGMPVRLDPRLTMAMFKGGAPIDQFLAHLREQAERSDAEQAFIHALKGDAPRRPFKRDTADPLASPTIVLQQHDVSAAITVRRS